MEARLRLFGDITDGSSLEAHLALSPYSEVGPDRRWILQDPASEPLPQDHPILLARPHAVEDAIRLRYEVRGLSHLTAAPGTILANGDFNLDVRIGLVTHFYASGSIPTTSLDKLLDVDLHQYISATQEALIGIDLHTRHMVLYIGVEEKDFSSAVDKLVNSIPLACGQLGSNKCVFQTNLGSVDAFVLIAVADEDDPTEDIFWYKYWQSCQAHRQLINHALRIITDSQASLTEAANFSPILLHEKDAIKTCLRLRSRLLETQDTFRSFSLMADTVRAFRKQLIMKDHVGEDSPPITASIAGLRDRLVEEEERLYGIPLDRIETVVKSLADTVGARLDSLTALQQASFNYAIQRRLIVFQWIMFTIAILSLILAAIKLS